MIFFKYMFVVNNNSETDKYRHLDMCFLNVCVCVCVCVCAPLNVSVWMCECSGLSGFSLKEVIASLSKIEFKDIRKAN